MRTIKIDKESNNGRLYYHDDWKGFVYFEDEFDKVFVITGNKEYNTIESASWYQKTLSILEDIDLYCERDDHPELTEDQWESLVSIYNNYSSVNQNMVYDALKILYPDDEFEITTIRGNVQGKWQDVICKKSAIDYYSEEIIKRLEAFYFGLIAEVMDDDCVDYVTLDELWDAEYNHTVDKFIRDLLDISDDEEIEIQMSDGYETVKKWKKVV